MHCVTVWPVPEHADALATHAYVEAPPPIMPIIAVPAVRQQNCDVAHDNVVEVGGHAMLLLTIMPASVTPLLVPAVPEVPEVPVVPVLVPVEAPLPVPVVPVVAPEAPDAVPLVPEEPLLVEPPQATPTATTTTEVRRIVRTGFKTRYLQRS